MGTISGTVAELHLTEKQAAGVSVVDPVLERMEPASGLEPPTCGLRIRRRGVAQVIDDLGNPLVILADRTLGRLAHSASPCRSPAPFVGPSDTVLTPGVGQGWGIPLFAMRTGRVPSYMSPGLHSPVKRNVNIFGKI